MNRREFLKLSVVAAMGMTMLAPFRTMLSKWSPKWTMESLYPDAITGERIRRKVKCSNYLPRKGDLVLMADGELYRCIACPEGVDNEQT